MPDDPKSEDSAASWRGQRNDSHTLWESTVKVSESVLVGSGIHNKVVVGSQMKGEGAGKGVVVEAGVVVSTRPFLTSVLAARLGIHH